MDRLDFYRSLATESDQRILFFVIDGLGGLPHPETGLTELEAAATPTLDALAAAGESGLATPVLAGVTPGSGPAHISLFGYDPLVWQVGRGVLAALGVEFDLRSGDVAARINFCSLDPEGRITDRRAGRIGDQIWTRSKPNGGSPAACAASAGRRRARSSSPACSRLRKWS